MNDLPGSEQDDAKVLLRRRMRSALAAIAPDARAVAAKAIVAPLLAVAGAGPVALFASMGNELDTAHLEEALWMRGVVRVFPQVVGDDLVFRGLPASVRMRELPRAAFGAPSPTIDFVKVPLTRCSLVIVPGLAFDAGGGRIGYGRGFYDRALVDVDPERVVGLCHDEQLVDAVPMTPQDRRITRLCTPSRGVFRAAF